MWDIKLLKDRGVIYVQQSDHMDKNTITKITEEVLRYGKEYGIDKYLIDHRSMMFDSFLSVVDIFDLPNEVVKIGAKFSNKVAVLISSENERINEFHFLETVFHNKGLRVDIFTEEDEALKWLS
jgi:hypothetical protein